MTSAAVHGQAGPVPGPAGRARRRRGRPRARQAASAAPPAGRIRPGRMSRAQATHSPAAPRASCRCWRMRPPRGQRQRRVAGLRRSGGQQGAGPRPGRAARRPLPPARVHLGPEPTPGTGSRSSRAGLSPDRASTSASGTAAMNWMTSHARPRATRRARRHPVAGGRRVPVRRQGDGQPWVLPGAAPLDARRRHAATRRARCCAEPGSRARRRPGGRPACGRRGRSPPGTAHRPSPAGRRARQAAPRGPPRSRCPARRRRQLAGGRRVALPAAREPGPRRGRPVPAPHCCCYQRGPCHCPLTCIRACAVVPTRHCTCIRSDRRRRGSVPRARRPASGRAGPWRAGAAPRAGPRRPGHAGRTGGAARNPAAAAAPSGAPGSLRSASGQDGRCQAASSGSASGSAAETGGVAAAGQHARAAGPS